MIKNLVKTRLPTGFGDFSLCLYLEGGKEHLALVKGEVAGAAPVPVRVHSECLTGDVFGSRRCDCGDQLKHTLMYLGRQEAGILIYLRQEGRGIGLLKKMEAYNLQDQGLDTVEANIQLGHQADERDYGIAARILRDLEVSSIRLITNNPHKVEELESHGIKVVARIPIEVGQHEENLGYLKSKAERMAHLLRFTEQVPTDHDFAFMAPLLDQLALARNSGQSRPFVTLAYAQSLDGVSLARQEGSVDRPRDLALGQYLGAHHDAILLSPSDGWSSLLQGPGAALRVVLDPGLVWGLEGFLETAEAGRIVVITTKDHDVGQRNRLQAEGIRVIELSSRDGVSFEPSQILERLSLEGVRTLLVHGEETTMSGFLQGQLIDYCVITLAACFVGGGSRALPSGLALPELRSCEFHPQGSDLIAFGAMSYTAPLQPSRV